MSKLNIMQVLATSHQRFKQWGRCCACALHKYTVAGLHYLHRGIYIAPDSHICPPEHPSWLPTRLRKHPFTGYCNKFSPSPSYMEDPDEVNIITPLFLIYHTILTLMLSPLEAFI